MRIVAWGLPFVGLLTAGCASTRPPPEEGPRVPVFQVADDLPCEYEVTGVVRAELRDRPRTDEEYRLSLQQALGRAGAEAGADAVIVRDFVLRLPFAVRGQSVPSSPRPVEGRAVRWIPGTCRG